MTDLCDLEGRASASFYFKKKSRGEDQNKNTVLTMLGLAIYLIASHNQWNTLIGYICTLTEIFLAIYVIQVVFTNK